MLKSSRNSVAKVVVYFNFLYSISWGIFIITILKGKSYAFGVVEVGQLKYFWVLSFENSWSRTTWVIDIFLTKEFEIRSIFKSMSKKFWQSIWFYLLRPTKTALFWLFSRQIRDIFLCDLLLCCAAWVYFFNPFRCVHIKCTIGNILK